MVPFWENVIGEKWIVEFICYFLSQNQEEKTIFKIYLFFWNSEKISIVQFVRH